MGVDGRPSTGWKYGANGAKNAGSSSNASTRARSSGSRSNSGGRLDSHNEGPSPMVRNMASIPSAQGVEVILPANTDDHHRRRAGVDGTFIWTPSHDQRLRSLFTAFLRSWLRSCRPGTAVH